MEHSLREEGKHFKGRRDVAAALQSISKVVAVGSTTTERARECADRPGELGGAVLVRPRRDVGQSAVMKRKSVSESQSASTKRRQSEGRTS